MLVLLFVLVLAPTVAGAAQLRAERGAYSYRAAPSERNVLDVSVSGGSLVFADAGATIALKGDVARCERDSEHQVACRLGAEASAERVSIALGDDDDTSRLVTTADAPVSWQVTGDAGNDLLAGGDDGESLDGGAGDDRLVGGAGNDELLGERGDDRLEGGPGNDALAGDAATWESNRSRHAAGRDDLRGGTGRDKVRYAGRLAKGMTVTLDGRRNDGIVGERDRVRADVEDAEVSVSGAPTRIVGNNRANGLTLSANGSIVGGGGEDSINCVCTAAFGGPGADFVSGRPLAGSSRVTLDGGRGNDSLVTRGGPVYGGPGNDKLRKAENSEAAADDWAPAEMFGGPGDDRIDSVDVYWDDVSDGDIPRILIRVPDRVGCGAGRDRARLGEGDVAARDCERVTRDR